MHLKEELLSYMANQRMDLELLKKVGEELKQHRKSSGDSLDELSTKLKIRKSYLEAIEKCSKKQLPADIYIVGYIKKYAKFYGLNSAEYSDLFRVAHVEKMSSGSSKNLITFQDFIPTKNQLYSSFATFIILYVLFWLV
jgi:cytoskeletal protein RodZ